MSDNRNGDLDGKVAVVTGASSGIGRAIAILMAEEGASIVVLDLRDQPREGGQPTDELIREKGGKAQYLQLDVTDSDEVESIFSKVADERGLDVLVCAAGNIGPVGDFLSVGMDELDQNLSVNFRGLFSCNQAALRIFVPQGRGKIVNVASNLGFVGVHGMAVYCAVKGAVLNLTRSLAVEFGPHGINVNALCPGLTATALNEGLRSDPAMVEVFEQMTPLRMGEEKSYAAEPRDMAEAALFLASERSRFAAGTCLVVDGGWIAQ